MEHLWRRKMVQELISNSNRRSVIEDTKKRKLKLL